MTMDPRHTVFKVLRETSAQTITLDQALDRHREGMDTLPSRDRNLCTAIAFGVLRHQGYLDHLIRTFSKRPFEQLDPDVVLILRMVLFQIKFFDRIPDFAAIDTGIDLAKKEMGSNVAGFINAVLRQAARNPEVPLPDPRKQWGAYLKVVFSIPAWLGDRWTRQYGREKTLDLAQSLMQIAPFTLRVNTLKTERDSLAAALANAGITAQPGTHSRDGLFISQPGMAVTELPGFSDGWFQVQDEAAQLVSMVLDPRPGERVLDACAGLGGKTCHLGQLMENQGEILALDIDPAKLEQLSAETRRLGLNLINGQAMDVSGALARDVGGYFDRVLVDAPCTGLGVIRRNPDTRWKRTPRDIQRMAARQKKILNAAAGLVRPGGILVYAVCSCEPEENEGVVDQFLSRRKDYEPDPGSIRHLVPGLALYAPDGFWVKTFPDPGNMDGFFMARMIRKQTP